MIDQKEYQKKAERTAYVGLFFSLIASILLIFVVYDPTFSIFENKKSALIEKKIKLKTAFILEQAC
jgi:hypothetical protein